MPLSREDIEKIYNIKKKLLITYKAASTAVIKKRISGNLKKIEKIIEDIESGKEIDPTRLNIFSDEIKSDQNETEPVNTRINYVARVDNLKISETSKDSEIDQIYSFIVYFDKNFSIPLRQSYLKLDYYLSKKRDLILDHYDSFKLVIKEYVDDLEVLAGLRFNEQIEKYKVKITQQKKFFLVKLSEMLHELKDFLAEIISDYEKGRKSFFNPDENFVSKFALDKKTELEGETMQVIVRETYNFILDFIDILRMPDFRKNS